MVARPVAGGYPESSPSPCESTHAQRPSPRRSGDGSPRVGARRRRARSVPRRRRPSGHRVTALERASRWRRPVPGLDADVQPPARGGQDWRPGTRQADAAGADRIRDALQRACRAARGSPPGTLRLATGLGGDGPARRHPLRAEESARGRDGAQRRRARALSLGRTRRVDGPSAAARVRVRETLELFAPDEETARSRLRAWLERPDASAEPPLDALVREVCADLAVPEADVRGGRRTRLASRARALVCERAVRGLSLSVTEVARALGVSHTAVSQRSEERRVGKGGR